MLPHEAAAELLLQQSAAMLEDAEHLDEKTRQLTLQIAELVREAQNLRTLAGQYRAAANQLQPGCASSADTAAGQPAAVSSRLFPAEALGDLPFSVDPAKIKRRQS